MDFKASDTIDNVKAEIQDADASDDSINTIDLLKCRIDELKDILEDKESVIENLRNILVSRRDSP